MWPGHSSNSSTIINYFFAIIYLTTYSFVDCNHKFSAVSKVKASERKHTQLEILIFYFLLRDSIARLLHLGIALALALATHEPQTQTWQPWDRSVASPVACSARASSAPRATAPTASGRGKSPPRPRPRPRPCRMSSCREGLMELS